jgi:alpha-glucosidase (family GH31 glycosyl hydrolase)
MALSHSNTPRSSRLAALLVLLAACAVTRADQGGIVIVGDVRFTLITPNCVRIEQSPGAKFVDDRSLLAVNREARTADYEVSQDGQTTVVRTEAMRLRYTPDGKPLSADNLSVEITAAGARSTRWTPGDKNSANLGGTVRTLDMWDGGGDLGEGLLSRDGWYLLDDSSSPLFTDDWVRARPSGFGTDWYLFGYGNDYKSALQSFTAFAGKVPLPRRYTLGSWYSRYWPYSSDDYRAIVKEYADHDFPLDVLVLDMDWHKDGWTGYSWNKKLLPDAPALLKWVHEQGLHVTLNDHPADGVKPHEDRYPDFMRALGKDPASNETVPYDAGSKQYLTAHYDNMMAPLVKDGVDFWWLDWQQYRETRSIPELTNLFWLNDFYYKQTSGDDRRGQIFSRWGGWGSHRYPIQFSGDSSTNWKMLAFEVPFTATAGNVGCFFWSHDIGGHQGARNDESYARWVQFGATTAALRSHSTRSRELDRRPWTYEKWAEDSMRESFHLRSRLMPYIYSSVQEASAQSIPFNRPMYLEYPNEERAYRSPQQYLLGRDLLVAPITSPGVGPNHVATQVVWFPPGDDWYNFFTGELYLGGTEQLVAADINEFPLYVRAGAPIPMQPYTQRMTTTPLDTLIVRVYPWQYYKWRTTTLYEDDGKSIGYERGEFATTKLSYRAAKSVEIDIDATKGSFVGQPEERVVVIELPNTERADFVRVNKTSLDKSSIEYDEATCTNRITLPRISIRTPLHVSLQAQPADMSGPVHRARARRSGVESLAIVAPATRTKQRLANAFEFLKGADPTALLASFGIGVFEKNETAYRWPEHGVLGLYAPKELIDDDRFTYTFAGGSTPIALQRDPSLGGLAPFPIAKLKPFPAEPKRFLQGEIALAIGGNPLKLKGPDVPVDFASSDLNLAPKAKATASTATQESPAAGVVDGLVGGYPQQRKEEWSSVEEKAGASLTLSWDSPQTIDRVWLFDRQNLDDQVSAGELVFDTGDPVKFGELPNDANTGADVKFATRTTKTLTIRVTGVNPKTKNVGLSEVVVLRASK